jgi:putative DNA primase/helicase
VKRCGKSTLRDVLTPLVYRGLPADNISTAVVYRAMEECHPTLMIDEADSFLDENEEMRGIINAGHRRGAKALRMVNRQIEVFDPFGPKLIAGIGRRRDTIEDRAVIVKLRRRKADESVEAARLDRLDNRPLQSWARDNAQVA